MEFQRAQTSLPFRSQNNIISRRILSYNDETREVTIRTAFNSSDTMKLQLAPLPYYEAKTAGFIDVTILRTGTSSRYTKYWECTPPEFQPDAGADLK